MSVTTAVFLVCIAPNSRHDSLFIRTLSAQTDQLSKICVLPGLWSCLWSTALQHAGRPSRSAAFGAAPGALAFDHNSPKLVTFCRGWYCFYLVTIILKTESLYVFFVWSTHEIRCGHQIGSAKYKQSTEHRLNSGCPGQSHMTFTMLQ